MKTKKSDQVNLEKKRKAFFHIGLLTSLAATLLAFEWSNGSFVEYEMKMTEDTYELPPEDPVYEQPRLKKAPPVIKKDEERKGDDVDQKDKLEKKIVIDSTTVQKKVTTIPIDLFASADSTIANIEDDDDQPDIDLIYDGVSVDVKASFPDGTGELMKFLRDNTNYPAKALELNVQGRVYVKFVVEIDGTVSQVEAIKGPKHGLRKEAERVTKLIPKWNPATKNGKPVRSYFRLPFIFKTGH